MAIRAVVVGCAIALTVLTGCTGSSPRFRSSDVQAAAVDTSENEIRFAARIREEVQKEDDRKIDPERMKRRVRAQPTPGTKYSNITPAGIDRDRVLLDVVSFLGVPYEYGGTSKEGIDCSGFTLQIYRTALERSLPRSASAQFQVGKPVQKAQLQFGDLVFFNTTGRVPSHVGLYIEDDVFAHASVTQGVTFSSLESTYYRNRFVGARRIADEERGQ